MCADKKKVKLEKHILRRKKILRHKKIDAINKECTVLIDKLLINFSKYFFGMHFYWYISTV